MAVIIVTTDINRVYSPMNVFMTNYNNNSITLHVNSKGPFTLHYAIWPFFGLISLIATVWFFVYISTALARRHSSKNEQHNFASYYVTQDSTMGGGGGNEASTIVSPTDV